MGFSNVNLICMFIGRRGRFVTLWEMAVSLFKTVPIDLLSEAYLCAAYSFPLLGFPLIYYQKLAYLLPILDFPAWVSVQFLVIIFAHLYF